MLCAVLPLCLFPYGLFERIVNLSNKPINHCLCRRKSLSGDSLPADSLLTYSNFCAFSQTSLFFKQPLQIYVQQFPAGLLISSAASAPAEVRGSRRLPFPAAVPDSLPKAAAWHGGSFCRPFPSPFCPAASSSSASGQTVSADG